MRLALCADEVYPVQARVREEVEAMGHEVIAFGALASGAEAPWALAAEAAALAVAVGTADEGIFFCWSGTGICMAANDVLRARGAAGVQELAAVEQRQLRSR